MGRKNGCSFGIQLKKHIVDSTALLAVATPVLAGLETTLLGMSDKVSINARLLSACVTYGGTGYLVARGRDLYRKIMKVEDSSKERVQQFHDSLYSALFNLVTTPPLYYASGARDLGAIVNGTFLGIGLGLVSGGLVGYFIDTYRDLTGIKESQRVPSIIRNRSPKFKLGVAAIITAASVGLAYSIYIATPDKLQNKLTTPGNIIYKAK